MKEPNWNMFRKAGPKQDNRNIFEHENEIDDGDDDDDGSYGDSGGPVDIEDSDFIVLNGGLEYIRKFEIVGLRWSRYTNESGERDWRLHVFFNDCPHTIIYADEARMLMRAFDLPEEPPEGK